MLPVLPSREVQGGRGKRFAAEAGLSGGGGGFASEPLQSFLHYCLARPATSAEVRRIPESTR